MIIALISGPNLNMLGKRDENHYGSLTLQDIENLLRTTFPEQTFICYQSNHEGALIDFIQTLEADAIIINAAAYTHTSIAIRDALDIRKEPVVEVHLSDVDQRESFRRINYIRDIAKAHFQGKKEQSYIEAVRFLLSNN